MTLTELQDYYANQLIAQYRGLNKASNTMRLVANMSLCDGLMLVEPTCFDLDTAIGAQLTILGNIVGAPRNVIGLDLVHTFFQFTRYAGSPAGVGFGRYNSNPYPTSIFKRYHSGETYTLTDFEMRYLIKLKIIYNNTWTSTKYLIEALWNLFGSAVSVVDNQDMTIIYNVLPPYTNIFIVAQFLDILPRPMAVGATVNYETAFLTDQSGETLLDEQGHPLYAET